MKQKHTFFVLSFFAVLAFSFAGCNGGIFHTHKPVKTQAKAATCEDTGNLDYWTCKDCNKVFSDEACETETTLEKMTTPATGHTHTIFKYDTTDHWYECSCGDIKMPKQAHSGGTATCEGKALCSICSQPYGSTLGGHADENKDHICDNQCGTNLGDHTDSATDKDHVCDYGCSVTLEECSGGTDTCTKGAICSICEKEYGSALGHDYTEMLEDVAHWKNKNDSQTYKTYWYDCSRCDSNAKEDENATDKYFQVKTVYDTDSAKTAILQIAPQGVTEAYLLNANTETDVTDKTLGDIFTAEETNAGATKTVVYYDASNVAYTLYIRYVTKIVDSEAELKQMLQLDATADGSASTATTGYYLLEKNFSVTANNTYQRYASDFTLDGNGYTLTISMMKTHCYGLFYSLTDSMVKNLKLDITKDFPSETADTDINLDASSRLLTFSTSGSVFENVEMNFHRANGDVDLSYSYGGGLSEYRLYLTAYNKSIQMNHSLIKIDDGFFKLPESVTSGEKWKNRICVYAISSGSYGHYVICPEKLYTSSSAFN